MIYISKVSAFAFTTKLNIPTCAFGFKKLGYLRVTMFGLIEWPFLWLRIPRVLINGSQYPHLGFLASIFLYPPIVIKLISSQYVVLFT